ncbi:MAG: hypothetical protein EBX30_14790, partial [Betaproteobacteria bacterium]|nr:hypothetical protein [Betaproteobacteria bacterium]
MNDQQRHSKEVLKRSKLCLLPGRFVPAIHGLALAMGCCVGLAMSTKSLAACNSLAFLVDSSFLDLSGKLPYDSVDLQEEHHDRKSC